jgi:hypothetical protein
VVEKMSDKFRSSLVNKIEEKRAFEEKQNNLKEKHGIEEENVIVVEKTNMIKFFIQTVIATIKVVATISILVLAAIGLLTVVYPELRNPFVELLISFREQILLYVKNY